LARYGDIISVIPVAQFLAQQEGGPIDWVVHKAFADVLRGCSYIRPVVYDSNDPQNMHGGLDFARRQFPGRRLLVTQVNANPEPPPRPMCNFICEQWLRAGMLDYFHTLLLVFDRRNEVYEREALEKYWPKTKKPVLLVNLSSHSSPFKEAASLREWIQTTLGKQYTILNMSAIRFRSFLEWLPFLERAAVLITSDSAPLHLAYATMTPTFALSRDSAWYQSEPRAHWIGRLSYAESMTKQGRAVIERELMYPKASLGTLVRTPEQMLT